MYLKITEATSAAMISTEIQTSIHMASAGLSARLTPLAERAVEDVDARQRHEDQRGGDGDQQAPRAQLADDEVALRKEPPREDEADRVEALAVSMNQRGESNTAQRCERDRDDDGSAISPRKLFGQPKRCARHDSETAPQLIFDDRSHDNTAAGFSASVIASMDRTRLAINQDAGDQHLDVRAYMLLGRGSVASAVSGASAAASTVSLTCAYCDEWRRITPQVQSLTSRGQYPAGISRVW